MQPVPAQRTILATVPAGSVKGARILFPIDKFLLNRQIVAIETVNADQQAIASNGLPVVTAADALNITVTFVVGSAEVHHAIPLALLNTVLLAGLFKTITPTVIDWNSSYVTLTETPTVATTFVVPFLPHYIP